MVCALSWFWDETTTIEILLIWCINNEKTVITWLQQTAIPIQHVEAGNGFADLQPLKQMLQDVKVVGLGEPTHGTREIFQLKHRLVEFLVTEMNFTTFATEVSFAACQPINSPVTSGSVI